MKELLLTIGIPTFNGDKYLEETINSALRQILELKVENVEILVSDNASTDQTKKIVDTFLEEYPRLVRYFRNESNVGFDANLDLIFKRARGKYVEILGDDDFLCDGALENILRILSRSQTISVIMLNIAFLDILTNKEFGESIVEDDMVFHNGDDFFQFTKWQTSAVSSLILLRQSWNSLDLAPHLGNQWIHISAIISILATKSSSYVVSKKTVIVRTGNTRWSHSNGNQLKLGLKHLKAISYMCDLGYKMDTYQFFLRYRFSTNISDILYLAPYSFSERLKVLRLMISFFKIYPRFWCVDILVLLILSYPLQLSKPIVKYLYKRVKSGSTLILSVKTKPYA